MDSSLYDDPLVASQAMVLALQSDVHNLFMKLEELRDVLEVRRTLYPYDRYEAFLAIIDRAPPFKPPSATENYVIGEDRAPAESEFELNMPTNPTAEEKKMADGLRSAMRTGFGIVNMSRAPAESWPKIIEPDVEAIVARHKEAPQGGEQSVKHETGVAWNVHAVYWHCTCGAHGKLLNASVDEAAAAGAAHVKQMLSPESGSHEFIDKARQVNETCDQFLKEQRVTPDDLDFVVDGSGHEPV